MPLLPIDLQTMFSQLSQIGREQAVQKEVPPQYQAVQAEQLVRRAEQEDKTVTQSREPGEKEGAEKVGDAGRRRRRRGGPQERRPGAGQEPAPERPEVFEDPALGHNVDLVG